MPIEPGEGSKARTSGGDGMFVDANAAYLHALATWGGTVRGVIDLTKSSEQPRRPDVPGRGTQLGICTALGNGRDINAWVHSAVDFGHVLFVAG